MERDEEAFVLDRVVPLVTGPRRFVLLLHPGAGGGRGRRLRQALSRTGLSRRAEIAPVRNSKEACGVLAAVSDQTVPVIAGGDGTANLVVCALHALRQTGRALGLLPLGTGNALAHSVGLDHVDAALAALETGVPRPLDLMRTNHPDAPVALLSLSAGFEAGFIAALARWRCRGKGPGLLAASAAALGARSRAVALELDGTSVVARGSAVYSVGLYNLLCYGFGRRVFRDAELADGWGEAMTCRTHAAYWATLALGAPALGRPLRRWRQARFSAPLFQIDGEPHAGGELTVLMEPAAYRLLVPEHHG